MGSFLSILSPSKGAVFGSLLFYIILSRQWKRNKNNLPPSPNGLPLIGHLHLMPLFAHGSGQDVIIINDYQAAVEILDKRSAIYSSRPRLVVADDYASTNRRLVLLPYGDRWRAHRSAFHREMTPNKIVSYIPIQVAETKILMKDLLMSPENFIELFRKYSGNVILKVTYGLNSEDGQNQKAIDVVYEVMERFLASARPGAHLVDLFPILDKLPNVLAPWRPAALQQQRLNQEAYGQLLNEVKGKVTKGELAPDGVFAARLWQDKDKLSLDELDCAYLAGTMFEAGTDTTAAALSTFVLAAVTHPEAYIRGQEEVDRICGDHSPTMEDFEKSDYIRAMVKETFRWRTVTAGGIPHLSTSKEDDSYEGFRIPAGATVIANHWGMCFSEKTFGQKYDPQLFEPRRWIERPEGVGPLDEGHPTFGFARRVCPGKPMAINSMFLVVSNLCYNFDIKAKPGVKIDTFNYTIGFNIEPEHFECIISARGGRVPEIEREAELARDILRRI